MQKLWAYWRSHTRLILWLSASFIALASLLLYRLGTLTLLSAGELQSAVAPVGLHGVYQHPFNAPLELIRSIVFFAAPNHGGLLTRLPNAVFGGMAVVSFGWLVWLWHGQRTMVLATFLFACSAWTLHVSRLASFDVLYLWATPSLLLAQLGLQQHAKRLPVWLGCLAVWGLILTIPGMVWFVALSIYLQRKTLVRGWKHFSALWQRSLSVLVGVLWLPLIAIGLSRSGQLLYWLGMPTHFAMPTHLLKDFIAVPVHIFFRGPQYPSIWLAKAPILDIFTLAICLVGIYFYAMHLSSKRSRLLASTAVISWILVAVGGPVGLSVVVPIAYLAAATGLAYLLRDWLKVFPRNPLARGVGVGLLSVAVAVSCLYNLRSYFVAWPHNRITQSTFIYSRP